METEYRFNPENFGYEPVEKFPEIKDELAPNSFVKVTAIGGKEKMGRSVYWYSTCAPMHDDRWKISSGSYDSAEQDCLSHHQTDYCGLISNENFAEMLLKHIFGTWSQSSVENEGLERLKIDINSRRFD